MLMAVVSAQGQMMPEFDMDPAIRYGKLDNGLTYYIRHNEEPKDRANFYIAQKVGSVQEDDDQRGLAHFLEHMCFNGTEHFPGNAIVQYCERIGVKFGYNLNAYTSADETVYNINDVPTTSMDNIDSCLLILSDWADGLLLEPEEIDKERGVIHEEWRLRSSAGQRVTERNLPTLFPGSKYGQRMPIGLMEIIDTFEPEALRAYYEKWYRPDLQGIIVVGDLDVDYVEGKIKELFGSIAMPANVAAFERYPVPDNDEPIYVVDKDKEAQSNIIYMMFKQAPMPQMLRNSHAALIMNYTTAALSLAVSTRLNELSKKADCPFLSAGMMYGTYIMGHECDALSVYVLPKAGQDDEAVKAVMTEIERARRYGITPTEMVRVREELVSQMERIYDNRAKKKNDSYGREYVTHFIQGTYIPDLETEYETYKMYANMLPTEMINESLSAITASTDTNFVCFAIYIDREDVKVPSENELRIAIEEAKTSDLEAYVDNVKDEPLIAELPTPVAVASETDAPHGYKCWSLTNGARVYYRKTDYDDAKIMMAARSFGGQNMLPLEDIPNADLMTMVMDATGLGTFTSIELEKKLAGKQVSISPELNMTMDRLNGESTPKDLRTLFELIYLHFQEPCIDEDGYNNVIATIKATLANIVKDPQTAFSDSLQRTLYNHDERIGGVIPEIEKADYPTIRRIYSERFSSAGDFDFFFTGAFDEDSLKAYTEQYIAPLKGVEKREQLTDLGIRPVTGMVNNRFTRAMETPKANIAQIWTGETVYTDKKEATATALSSILNQRYYKSIREDGSMAYSVGTHASVDYQVYDSYQLKIVCPVKPEKMDSALILIRYELDDIAANGVTEEELSKVREFEVKNYNDNQRKNIYWQNRIVEAIIWGKDTHTNRLDNITSVTSADVRDLVKEILNNGNCVTVTMLPEQ